MKGSIVALLAMLPLAAGATAVVVGPPLTGTTTVVNNGPGDHSDPHVSGNVCAYSTNLNGAFTVRYHDISTGSDNGIPNDGTTMDFLSDVSGNAVAFTRVSSADSQIFTYSLGAAAPTVVAPIPGASRQAAQIGTNTIAWQDFSSSGASSDIVVYDAPSGTVTRLTQDGALNQQPALSPDGSVVAWSKCLSASTCDIWTAVGAGGVWTSHQITNGAGNCSHPDSNGQVVVYSCNRVVSGVAKNSLYWQPVAGGAEQSLTLSGSQVTPSIAGQFIAFASEASSAANHDIYVLDLATSTTYQVTNTTDDEQLNDVTVLSDGTVRLVWQVQQSSLAVYAFSFKVAPTCSAGGGDDGDGDRGNGLGDGDGNGHRGGDGGSDCNNPGSRPLLSTLQVAQAPGQSGEATTTFAATAASDALLCVDNGFGGFSSTAGDVKLNQKDVVTPDQLADNPGLIQADVVLRSLNTLSLDCDRPYGSGYRVRVYGTVPACASADRLSLAGLHVSQLPGLAPRPEVIVGTQVELARTGSALSLPLAQPVLKGAGCASVPGGTAASAVLAMLAWLSFGRFRAVARATRRRR